MSLVRISQVFTPHSIALYRNRFVNCYIRKEKEKKKYSIWVEEYIPNHHPASKP